MTDAPERVYRCNNKRPEEQTLEDLLAGLAAVEAERKLGQERLDQANSLSSSGDKSGRADYHRSAAVHNQRVAGELWADLIHWPGVRRIQIEIESEGGRFGSDSLRNWRAKYCISQRLNPADAEQTRVSEIADKLDQERESQNDLSVANPNDAASSSVNSTTGPTCSLDDVVELVSWTQSLGKSVNRCMSEAVNEVAQEQAEANKAWVDSIFGPIRRELHDLNLPDDDLWKVIELAEKAGYKVDQMTYADVHKIVTAARRDILSANLRKVLLGLDAVTPVPLDESEQAIAGADRKRIEAGPVPPVVEDGDPESESEEWTAQLSKLSDRHRHALIAFAMAESATATPGKRFTRGMAWDWVDEHYEDYQFTGRQAFEDYVTQARGQIGANVNKPRKGRTGRSIAQSSDL